MATEETEKKNRGNAGKGRRKGSKNRNTAERKVIGEIFKSILGFDPATNQFYGPGLKVRKRIEEMLIGKRDVDTDYVNLHKYLMSYAFGTPMRMTPDEATYMSRRMAFITARGLPWEQDPLAKKESELLALLARQEEAEEKKEQTRAIAAARGRPASEDQEGSFTYPGYCR
jgi:hypothetical protein